MAGQRDPMPLGMEVKPVPHALDGVQQRIKPAKAGPAGLSDADKKAKQIQMAKATATELLGNANMRAFINAIAKAEGGDYNLKFGGVKGKKNDKWQFSDYSTHPGAGSDGKTTAAGMYQINIATWKEMGGKIGLTDFSPATQDLIAVEILHSIGVSDEIVNGDLTPALSAASRRWAALPKGPGLPGRYDQPYMPYDEFISVYKANGGSLQ